MEWIIFFLILWALAASAASEKKSNSQQKLPKNLTELLYLRISEVTSKTDGFISYDVAVQGLLPNLNSMNLVGVLYLYDDETKAPFVSNFTETDESPKSRVFRRNISFGFKEIGLYYENWQPITNYCLGGIRPPRKGNRKVNFAVFYFDADNPVIFNNGQIIQGKENVLHVSKISKTITFDEPGYMDEIENAFACKPLMVEIAMNMAMSDGVFDEAEGNIIKKWIKQEIGYAQDTKKDDLKKQLNDSLESSYKKILATGNVNSSIDKFNDIATKSFKYQLIELCLDILSADGVAAEEELKNLEALTDRIGLKFDEVQKMKDKALVRIVTKPSSTGQSATDESIVGLKKGLSNEDTLKFIKKEYRKWNGRLNILKPGNERDNAQRFLDTLARLRKKYEQ